MTLVTPIVLLKIKAKPSSTRDQNGLINTIGISWRKDPGGRVISTIVCGGICFQGGFVLITFRSETLARIINNKNFILLVGFYDAAHANNLQNR